MNKNILDSIAKCVRGNKGTFLKHKSNRVSEWIVYFNGSVFRILYDRNRHIVLTFLPLPKAYRLGS